MDPDVVKALTRWPNVPAAYGWLSLTRRGQWRFHPNGEAAKGAAGEPITNERITAFIDRNYSCDAAGHWFFQNGPQRAYVRLDAAPFILRYSTDAGALVTHTGEACGTVSHWWLDGTGHLFATTAIGPCLVDDRELMTVFGDMRLSDSNGVASSEQREDNLLSTLSELAPGQSVDVNHRLASAASPLTRIDDDDVASRLAFVSCPMPPSSTSSALSAKIGEPSAR